MHRGKYDGPEPARLAVLKFAAHLGASHVDVELKAAPYFFAGMCSAAVEYAAMDCQCCLLLRFAGPLAVSNPSHLHAAVH